jgi:hypothetical protein
MTAVPAALGEAMEEVLWQSYYTSCSTTRGSNARKRFHFFCNRMFDVDMVILL